MPSVDLDRVLLLGGYGIIGMAGALALALVGQCLIHRRADEASQPLRTSAGKSMINGEEDEEEDEEDEEDADEQQFDDLTRTLGAVELLQAAVSQEQAPREQPIVPKSRPEPKEGNLVFLE